MKWRGAAANVCVTLAFATSMSTAHAQMTGNYFLDYGWQEQQQQLDQLNNTLRQQNYDAEWRNAGRSQLMNLCGPNPSKNCFETWWNGGGYRFAR